MARPLLASREMRAPLETTASTGPLGDLSTGTGWGFSGSLVSCSIAARECPNCALSRQVWSRVAADQFGFNSLVALAPLLVVLAFAGVVEVAGRRSHNGKRLPKIPDRLLR